MQIKGVGSGGKEQRTSSNRLSGSCSGMSLYQPGLSLHPVSWLSHHFSCLELIPKESAEGKLWRRREGRTVYLQLREGCIRPLVEGEGRRGESLDRLLGSGGSLVYNGLVTLDCKAVPFLEMGWVGGPGFSAGLDRCHVPPFSDASRERDGEEEDCPSHSHSTS